MQVNRKYNVMIILFSILMALAIRSDSSSVTLKHNIESGTSNKVIIMDNESVTELNSKYGNTYTDNEDSVLAESKIWIINKETILGY